MSDRRSAKPKGLRRAERWAVGIVMGVIAFVLEKAVMRSLRKKDGSRNAVVPTTITSKGGDAEVR